MLTSGTSLRFPALASAALLALALSLPGLRRIAHPFFGVGIGARAEIRSYLSSFEALGESNGQQDFAFLGGVTLRLP